MMQGSGTTTADAVTQGNETTRPDPVTQESETTADILTQGGGRNMSGSQLVIILVVVCAVLGILLIGSTVLFIVILCLKRGRSNQITKKDTSML